MHVVLTVTFWIACTSSGLVIGGQTPSWGLRKVPGGPCQHAMYLLDGIFCHAGIVCWASLSWIKMNELMKYYVN